MVWDEKLWIRLKSASHVSDVICRPPFDFSYCLDPPMLRTEASVVYTGLGQRFYLACHVSAKPPADVTWTRQNRHVHVSSWGFSDDGAHRDVRNSANATIIQRSTVAGAVDIE